MPAPEPAAAYPVKLDVARPEASSRLLNFPLFIGIFIRSVLLIPHLVALVFLGAVALVLYLIATVAILFSGKYPKGLFDFIAGWQRWTALVSVYAVGLVDRYPPFTISAQEGYPAAFSVEYADKSNRLLNFPLLGVYIRELLSIPNAIVLALLGIVAMIVILIAPFGVLFTGKYPVGLHDFMVGVQRWSARLSAYYFGLTDKYPPFSLS
jgi:hypothetical protein